MSYWFSKSDDELAADKERDTGMGFILPTDADRSEAFKHIHLVKPELIQEPIARIEEFYREMAMFRSSPDLELFSYCGIDSRESIDSPAVLFMPTRLWENDSRLFGDVNCGTCRGQYLYTLRKRGTAPEKAQLLEILWLERYLEVNPECGECHYAAAANNLFVCKNCGRWECDLKRLGHTVYLDVVG